MCGWVQLISLQSLNPLVEGTPHYIYYVKFSSIIVIIYTIHRSEYAFHIYISYIRVCLCYILRLKPHLKFCEHLTFSHHFLHTRILRIKKILHTVCVQYSCCRILIKVNRVLGWVAGRTEPQNSNAKYNIWNDNIRYYGYTIFNIGQVIRVSHFKI